MQNKNTRLELMQQPLYTEKRASFTSTLEGKDVRRADEGKMNKCAHYRHGDEHITFSPLPAFGHPLPQGARKTAHGFTARSVTPQGRYAGYSGRPGFTLIELLVVVLIIGILAAVAVPQYQKAVWRSRFATIKALAKSIAQAEEIYYLSNGSYTTDVNNLDLDFPTPLSVDIEQTTTGYGQYYFPWGKCTLEVVENIVADVSCTLQKEEAGNSPLKLLSYFVYLNYSQRTPGKTRCFSYEKPSIYYKVCQSDTGLAEPTDNYTSYQRWDY